ncbi:MAG: molecular chaperone GrpE [Candidatus Peregrinibacteria bacterium Greene0416_19]|nr:MAG: molecular chaperone GrpE [Candidatus Peregrinibacteria bacterium Greene0416_19]
MDSPQPKAQKHGQGKGQGDHPPAPADGRVNAREAELTELKQQLAKLTDLAARSQADLQNAKARMEKDGGDMRRFATQAVLLRLLPVIDHFQRAFQHLPEDLKTHEWVKGVSAIEQDLMKVMTDLGLKRFDALGQPVDTARHDVVTVGPGKEGEILEVFEDGYELNGRVIRVAKVRVGDGNPKKE